MRPLSKILFATLVISTPALFFACDGGTKDDEGMAGSGGTDGSESGGSSSSGGSTAPSGGATGSGAAVGSGGENLGGGGLGGDTSTGGTDPGCFTVQAAPAVDCTGLSGTDLFTVDDCLGGDGPTAAVACYTDQGAFTEEASWMAGWTNWSSDSTPEDAGCASDGLITACDSGVCEYPKGVYDLKGTIYVTDGATIKFAPGTIIRGAASPKGSIIISRGAKIDAVGTQEEPIIFTSSAPNGSKGSGQWGGLILLGKARNFHGDAFNIEGLAAVPENQHGGLEDDDDSGTLKYVRLEFGGVDLGGGNEINGLSLGSIGSETELSYIQINTTLDDGFEFFGGMVDGDHFVVNNAGDDMYDADDGYRGTVSYLFGRHVTPVTGDPNGFELDGDNDAGTVPSGYEVNTTGTFENATLCTDSFLDGQAAVGYGAVLRRDFGGTLDSIVLAGFDHGIDLRESTVDLEVTNTQIWDMVVSDFNDANTAGVDGGGDPVDEATWFAAGSGNEVLP